MYPRLTTPTTATLQAIPDGKEGIKHTLKLMRSLVRTGKTKLPVRLLALRLVERNGSKEWLKEVADLHRFVRDKIRYIKDIRGVETLHTPEKTLELRQGDCDDKSILLASLLESIGHPTRFVAVSMHGDNYSHVLVETRIGTKWIPLETTEQVNVGWFPKGVTKTIRVHN